jgi:hypothetical protein
MNRTTRIHMGVESLNIAIAHFDAANCPLVACRVQHAIDTAAQELDKLTCAPSPESCTTDP